MAKVKISRKSTRIDMTAMCDVAFLLLSFFIMTATAKQPEPKPVDTPESTVQTKLPEEDLATITVGDEQVFFTIMDAETRTETLKRMSKKYNVTFTEQEYKAFTGMAGFGVPMSQMKTVLGLSSDQRNQEGVQKGIPYDSVNNQLKDWVKEAREAHRAILDKRVEDGATDVVYKDLDIAIKADAKEDYPTIKRVIEILQEQKKNRFFLVTGLRNENF